MTAKEKKHHVSAANKRALRKCGVDPKKCVSNGDARAVLREQRERVAIAKGNKLYVDTLRKAGIEPDDDELGLKPWEDKSYNPKRVNKECECFTIDDNGLICYDDGTVREPTSADLDGLKILFNRYTAKRYKDAVKVGIDAITKRLSKNTKIDR